MSELFGTPSGFRTYDKDRAELQQLAAQTQLVNAQTANQGAVARLNAANAAAITRKSEREDAELAAIQRALSGGPTGDDPIKRAQAVAGSYIAAGAVEKGLKIYDDAAAALQKMAGAEANKALEQRRRVQTELEQVGFIQQVMSGVRDAQSHAQALMILQGNPLTADAPLTEQLKTYNPGVIAQLLSGTTAKKAELEMRLSQSETASRNANRDSQIRIRNILKDQSERRTQAYVERQDSTRKVGGDRAIPPPTRAERNDVLRSLTALGFTDIEDGSVAAAEIASDARLLHYRNPAISLPQARAQAIQSAIARGDLKKTEGLFSSSTKYTLGGGSISRPLPLPKSKAELKEGAYYSADGEVRQFRGGKWVAAMTADPGASPALEEEDDE